MQPSEDDKTYLAHVALLREEMLNVFRLAAEDVATTDLGGAQQLMRTSLPPSPPPARHKHPLDGANGLGDTTHDAAGAHAAEQTTKRATNKPHDNDQDSDDDASDADESDDDPEDDDEDAD